MLKSTVVIAAAFCLIFSLPAQALNTRTWVSGAGIDQAGCGPIGNPCRTLQFAHDQTASGGEINFKDSAGYGGVVITKAINIVAEGVLAGVLAPAGRDAIEINASPNDTVLLRALTVEGAGVGRTGIVFNSGHKLDIADCVVQNFVGAGGLAGGGSIVVRPVSGKSDIIIAGTSASHNPSAAGILASLPSDSSANVRITIDHVIASDNSYGIVLDTFSTSSGYITAAVINTLVAANSQDGLVFEGANVNGSFALSSILHTARYGVAAYSNPNVLSFGNNQFSGNGNDVTGTIGTAKLK